MNAVRAEFNRRKKARQSTRPKASAPKPKKRKAPPRVIAIPTDPNSPSFFVDVPPPPKKVKRARPEAPPPPEPRRIPSWRDLADEMTAEFCFREQHPYNIFHGRAESPMGYPDKLYRTNSFLELMADTAERTHRETRGHEARKTPTETPFDELLNQRQVEKDPTAYTEGWCVNSACLHRREKDFSLTIGKDCYVCNRCGAVQPHMINAISLAREKNCAEEEDNTTRGDVVHEPTADVFMQPVRPASEMMRSEELRKTQGRHHISKLQRAKFQLGFGPEIADRGAVMSSDIFGKMEKDQRKRITNIQKELEKTFKEMNQSTNALLMAQMRRQTFRVFCDICKHVSTCKKNCKFEPLLQYPSATFAKCMLETELRRLQTRTGPELEGVDSIEIDRFANNLAGLKAQHLSRGVQAPSGASFGIAKSLLSVVVALEPNASIPECAAKEPEHAPLAPVYASLQRAEPTAAPEPDVKILLRNSVAEVLASHGRLFVPDIQVRCFDALHRIDAALIDVESVEQTALVFVMAVHRTVVARDEARGVVDTCTLSLEQLHPNLLVKLNALALDRAAFSERVETLQRAISMSNIDVVA